MYRDIQYLIYIVVVNWSFGIWFKEILLSYTVQEIEIKIEIEVTKKCVSNLDVKSLLSLSYFFYVL